ncbi:SpoIID/LytB domain-containing protein [Kribbella sp. NPDC051620]|uniref:SpoIID/LytB domain-containing protein n=1 Tax=Kribbella sp. NPDC051620 TaxID=3364120 RepID=UPI00378FEC4A
MKRVFVALIAGSTLLSATAVAVPPPEPEAVQTITGRGFGHGRGMSQYGAQGAALAGRSAKTILDFYYPGTTVGKATGNIRVQLRADTTDGVRIAAVDKLRLRDLKTGKVYTLPKASTRNQWSIDPNGEHGAKVSSYNTKTKTWTLWKKLTGIGQFEGPTVISLILPSGAVKRYRGVLRPADLSGAHFDTINVLPLELYLRGVVPREAVTTWKPAALQVQAVAARTYSVFHRNRSTKRAYDLCDTTSCQVYGGYNDEEKTTNAAITATAGQIRLYQGKPIMAEFSSSNGGATADGPVAYQVMKVDSWDSYPGNKNPNVTWTVTRTSSQLQATFGVGTLKRLRVVRRTGIGPSGGRVLTVEAVGSKGKVVLTGDQVRIRLHMRSAWFTFAGVQPLVLDMPTKP